MNLKQYATQSEKLFLADLWPEFATQEGDAVALDDRAWVIVRQATMQDHTRRAELVSEREERIHYDGSGRANSWGQVFKENPLRRAAVEVYCTLTDCGNLTLDDNKPVFPKMPANKMTQAEFDAIWGNLPPFVAKAIHEAALKINPDWRTAGE